MTTHQIDETLARLSDAIRQQLGSGVVVLAGSQNGRVPFVVGVTPDLTDRLHAGAIVNGVATFADGGGNSRNPQFARGQGTNPAKIGAALQHAYAMVEQALDSTN